MRLMHNADAKEPAAKRVAFGSCTFGAFIPIDILGRFRGCDGNARSDWLDAYAFGCLGFLTKLLI
jgi:hypothetical protein